jgi:bacterioferritin
MDFTPTIQISQMIVNELAGSAFVHKMQGQLFKSQGFTKLGEKYLGHYNEEMAWVEKYTDRLLDLGVVPEVMVSNQTKLIEDPKAYIEADYKLQKDGVETLYKAMPALASDPTTYDLTKAYLLDEEEDQYWDEEQLDLIEKIGYQNWLVKQL